MSKYHPKNKPVFDTVHKPSKNEPDWDLPDTEPTGPAKPEEAEHIVHGYGPNWESYQKSKNAGK